MHDGSGPSLYGRFAALGPDGSWEKTSEVFSLWVGVLPSEKFSETWPSLGTMRSGVCYPLPTLAPRIDGSASGSPHGWPTATVGDANGSGGPRQLNEKGQRISQSSEQVFGANLSDMAKAWTTPTVDDANNVTRTSGEQQSLARDTTAWSTPRAEDGERGQASQFDRLMEEARDWLTLTANDDAADVSPNMQEMLGHQVKWFADGKPASKDEATPWATPLSRDHKDTGDLSGSLFRADGGDRLDRVAQQVSCFLHGTTPSPSEAPTTPSDSSLPTRRRAGLNPRFGLWLMGYPVAWHSSVPTGTLSSPRARSASSKRSKRSKTDGALDTHDGRVAAVADDHDTDTRRCVDGAADAV